MMPAAGIQPSRVRYIDWLQAQLRRSGLSSDVVFHAYHLIDSHIIGFTLWESGYAAAARALQDNMPLRVFSTFIWKIIRASPSMFVNTRNVVEDRRHQAPSNWGST